MAKQENALEISVKSLEKITTENGALVKGAASTLSEAVAYASAVEQVMTALTPDVMARVFLPLKNKGRLGWRTDEKPGETKYSLDQLRDAWCDALLRGALPINDEVCLIGGNSYLEKNHFKRKLRQYPELTDLRIQPGKVEMKPTGALIEMSLTCKIGGKDKRLDRTGNSAIPVRLNANQGADAGLGKAERKILSQFYGELTGSEMSDTEFGVEDLDVKPTNGRVVSAEIKEESATPIPKPTRTEQTAAALKAVRESKPQAEGTSAPADATVPWKEDENKPEVSALATKEKTVGWVKGADGKTTKITKEVPFDPPKEAPPADGSDFEEVAKAPEVQRIDGLVTRCGRTKLRMDGEKQVYKYIININGTTPPAPDEITYVTEDEVKGNRANAFKNSKKQATLLYVNVNGEYVIQEVVDAATGEVDA